MFKVICYTHFPWSYFDVERFAVVAHFQYFWPWEAVNLDPVTVDMNSCCRNSNVYVKEFAILQH